MPPEKQAGQIALTPFPHADMSGAKLRPVLMLRRASRYDERPVYMVTSKLDFDIHHSAGTDFRGTHAPPEHLQNA